MLQIENQCVDCGLPCIGSTCPYKNVRVFYCDQCGSDDAECRIDGEDYCWECAKRYMQEVFDSLPLWEQADILDVDLQFMDDIID